MSVKDKAELLDKSEFDYFDMMFVERDFETFEITCRLPLDKESEIAKMILAEGINKLNLNRLNLVKKNLLSYTIWSGPGFE